MTALLLLLVLAAPLAAEDKPFAPIQGQPDVEEVTHPAQEGSLYKVILALFALIVLLFLAVLLMRRMGTGAFRRSGSSKIQILERRPLSQKTQLYLIEIEGKELLIAESQLEVRALTPLTTKKEG